MTTTMTRPNYTPVYEDGQRKQIQGMAASSIGHQFYQVSQCDRCHAYVAWAKSTKTGKWYVCETLQYTTPEAGRERFRAVPYKFHQCQEVDHEVSYRSIEERAMGDDSF